MARIIGAVGMSHVPVLGKAIAQKLQQDPYFKPWFDGFAPVHHWLDQMKPDIVVVFYNDHGLNFFLDKMPTFAIGAAEQYRNADEGWGIPTLDPFRGAADLSWHIIDQVIRRDFDLTTCQEMLVDHAFTLPLAMLWPDQPAPRAVPIAINTVQYPLPSAARCYALGEAVGDAIRSWPEDARVLLLATGGLSHQLDGERAGFINKPFDLKFLDSLSQEPKWATRYSIEELVEQTGTQGVELIMWLAARGALGGPAAEVHRNYHIPISNTAAGLIALAPA
ncbi:MAG: class III extradiol dioxygenase family protein [Burkholderiaceae bacterium]